MPHYRAEILTIFGFINSFWNLLAFNGFESFLVLPPDSLKNTKEAIYFVDNPTKDLPTNIMKISEETGGNLWNSIKNIRDYK